ncbi:hypothetical protein [Halothiobacillus sp.]|uniref:hypothetical protein n=1 Tax=Halothiobacillus sp. TaxID=1891311 RepID=UPI002AD4EB02|nr:hypothetical protein [Halothiobacillus sp.]
MSPAIWISIISVIIAGFALWNSSWQRRIASEAHRLNLYQRRFSTFDTTISFYRQFSHAHQSAKWTRIKYEEEALEFTSAVNEASFLFNPSDGIPYIMKEILYESDQIHRGISKDMYDLDRCSIELRKKVEPYLNFHQITGRWLLSKPNIMNLLRSRLNRKPPNTRA